MKLPFDLDFSSVHWEVIKTIPPQTFWLIFGCLTFLLLLSIYQAYKKTIEARSIEDTPISKIRSAAQGWVVVEGTQHFFNAQPIIAPLSKTPCTWWYYSVRYRKKKGWVELEKGSSASLFILKDGTGECVIDPQGANVTPLIVDSWGGFKARPTGKPKSWLGRLWGTFGNFRYYEYRMEDGNALLAMGYFQTSRITDASDAIRNNYKPTSSEDNVNVISNLTANTRQPYILSAETQAVTIQKIKRKTALWVVSYLTFFVFLSFVLIIRVS